MLPYSLTISCYKFGEEIILCEPWEETLVVAYRELKLFDEPFPTWDQMLSGDPDRPRLPKESWRQHMQPGEFALHFKHFQTSQPIGAAGEILAQENGYCRVFDSIEAANDYGSEVCHLHPAVVCVIYDSSGKLVKRIYNRHKVTWFAIVMWTGTLFWLAMLTAAGLALAASAYLAAAFLLGVKNPTNLTLPGYAWVFILMAALALGSYGYWTRIKWKAKRRVDKLREAISPEERKYFEQLNALYGSAESAERERFLKIRQEFLEKARRAMNTGKK